MSDKKETGLLMAVALVLTGIFAAIGVTGTAFTVYDAVADSAEVSKEQYRHLAGMKLYANEEQSARICEMMSDGIVTRGEVKAFKAWNDEREIATSKRRLCE